MERMKGMMMSRADRSGVGLVDGVEGRVVGWGGCLFRNMNKPMSSSDEVCGSD